MRGRPYTATAAAIIARNTPAYAGKTSLALGSCRQVEKHPRVCGEDVSYCRSVLLNQETPPRMRGRPEVAESEEYFERNTPAYAGKTQSLRRSDGKRQKHPRVCGEDHDA